MLFHQTVLKSKELLYRIKQILESPKHFRVRTKCKVLCLLTDLRTALIKNLQCSLHDLIVRVMSNPTSDSP